MTREKSSKRPDSLDDARKALVQHEHGVDPGWCGECWGKRITVQGQPKLVHHDWCQRTA